MLRVFVLELHLFFCAGVNLFAPLTELVESRFIRWRKPLRITAKEDAPMSRISAVVLCLAAELPAMFGQKLLIEIDTQEGQMLQQIDTEKDAAKKVHPARDVREAVSQSRGCDLGIVEHSAAIPSDAAVRESIRDGRQDTEHRSHRSLRSTQLPPAAEAKKDLALIRLWSTQTSHGSPESHAAKAA